MVEKYLEELEGTDQYEQGRLDKPFALDISQERLPDAEELRQRIRRHEQALEEMKSLGETQILYTDPDARVMKTKDGGRRACYNVQTAVEPQSHMVVGYEITNDRNDVNNLCSTAQIAKENLCRQSIRAIADKGYESRKDIEKCLMNGIVPDVGFVYDREFRVFNLDYIPANISAEQKASEKEEGIRACLHAGVLPACYENTNISLEVQRQNEISCFIRDAQGRVTCPMGRELYAQRKRKYGTVYAAGKHAGRVQTAAQTGKDTRR